MAPRRTVSRSARNGPRTKKRIFDSTASSVVAWAKRQDVANMTAQARNSRFVPSLILPTSTTVPSKQRRAQQQARRRRQTARQMRRFEAVVSHVQESSSTLPSISLPTFKPWQWPVSKLVSLLLVIVTLGAIIWVHVGAEWYVYREHVAFNELAFHEADALYPLLEVDGWNVFWISANQVRERLVALPTIADAQVQVRPPHWVAVNVKEAEPIARWVTQSDEFWLLPDGTALPSQDDRYNQLPTIIDNDRAASMWGDPTEARIDPAVLRSALALMEMLPTIEALYFHAEIGLNFHMPDGAAWVYWGDGSNMEQKYSNLQAVQTMLQREARAVDVVDIRSERPVLR